MCSLTFAIRKQRWRLAVGVLLFLTGTALGGYTTAAQLTPLVKGALAVVIAILVALGGWVFNPTIQDQELIGCLSLTSA